MATAPAVFAVAVVIAVLAASASAFIAHRPAPQSYYTTSPLFDDLVGPLCTESSTNDACYGCFARYSKMKQAPTSYEELKRCAREYLNGTSFAECQTVIGDADVSDGEQSPVFCDFEKCVRKRDMVQLADACTKQNDNSKSEGEKYIQTTACILEEMQRRNFLSGPRYPGGFGSPMTYSLYVTEAGELRVTSTFAGGFDQYTCEPAPSPPVPLAASSPMVGGAF